MDAVVYDTDERIASAMLEILKRSEKIGTAVATTDWPDLQNRLSSHPKSVVVLGPGLDEQDLTRVPDVLRESPSASFIQVVEQLDAESLKRAMRFGIRDVLAIADGGSELAETVVRAAGFSRTEQVASPIVPTSQTRGRVVAVFGTKGGTGKSFVATNLAVLGAQTGLSTALVDASVRFGDCASLLRVRPVHTVADLGAAPAVDRSLVAGVLGKHESGVHLLSAPYDPLAADDLDPVVISRAVQALREMVDLVVVDTGPALDGFTVAALDGCDVALLVASLEVPAIKDAKVCITAFDRLGLNAEKVRVVLNRANSSVAFPVKEVTKSLGRTLFAELPSDVAVPRSMNAGIPVLLGHPKAKVSKALLRLWIDLHAPLGLARTTTEKSTRKSPLRVRSARPAES